MLNPNVVLVKERLMLRTDWAVNLLWQLSE